MTREEFQPATILNLLAAAWIQFMVHDWFVHKRSDTDAMEIPRRRGETGAPRAFACRVRCPNRSLPDSTRPPAYTNLNSHWWDSSQIYGCDAAMAAKLRTGIGGQAAHRADGVAAGRPGNRASFQRLHRQLVDRFGHAPHALHAGAQPHLRSARGEHPTWTDDTAVRKGRLINSALMAQDPYAGMDDRDRAAPGRRNWR